MSTRTRPSTFAERLRLLASERGLSFADVAQSSQLDPSVVSRLAAEGRSRRAPRHEHVLALARAFMMTPSELVFGTDAAALLGDWVPRESFDDEVRLRLRAHEEAAEARTKLAESDAVLSVLRQQVDELDRQAAAAKQAARTSEERAAAERARAMRLGAELSNTQKQLQTVVAAFQGVLARARALEQELKAANQGKDRNAMLAVVGTILGGVVGAKLSRDEDD